MACPHVAGVAALLFSIFENASSRPVSDALFNSAQGLGHCGKNAKFGHGHVDAKAAADLLQSGILPQANCEEAAVTIKPDQYGSETTWQITNPQGVSIAGGGPYQDGNQDFCPVNATLSPSLIPAAMGKSGFDRFTNFFVLGITDAVHSLVSACAAAMARVTIK